jgi:sugar lactone lactonase YvrE
MKDMSRNSLTVRLLVVALTLAGCASNTSSDRDDENGYSPQWPPAPQAARISYQYSLTTPGDANIGNGFLNRTWKFIKGSEPDTLAKPQGIHVDISGRLYVVDTQQRRIHVFDSRNSRYFWFPEKPPADFEFPVDVTADGTGRVYVSDASTKVVHVFEMYGREYLEAIGADQLKRPTGLAIRPESNELLVVDTLASSLVVFDTRDFSVKARAGRDGLQSDALHFPTNIALAPDGTVYVTDALNFRIQSLKSDLVFDGHFGEAGDSPGFFSRPKGVAVDSDHNIYVVDALFDNVQIFNKDGELLMAFGTSGQGPGEFWLPNGIFIDSNDVIYVADSYNSRVQVFQYTGQAIQ